MKTTRLLLMLALVPLLAAAADAPYFNTALTLLHGKDGVPFTMTFDEVERTDTNSVVKVAGFELGTDLSNDFLLDCMCRLAQARGQRHFQAKKINSDPIFLTFEITFPMARPNSAIPPNGIAPNVFPVSQCPVTTGVSKN